MLQKTVFIWCEMSSRIRFKYNEWRCWFYFHHHMESLGKVAENKQLYQCSFCFKRIIVKSFGVDRGIVTKPADPNPTLPQSMYRKAASK